MEEGKELEDILAFKVEPSRKGLKKLLKNTRRKEFYAIFAEEFKKKEDWEKRGKFYKGQEFTLIKCLCDETGEKIAEHAWILFTKKMKKMELKRGDKIRFMGKVYKYAKNSKACDPHMLREHWSLGNIVDVEKVEEI